MTRSVFSLLVTLCFLFPANTLSAQQFTGMRDDIDEILEAIEDFSRFYVMADYESLANSYTTDGKIFPNNVDIIEGREAIKKRWELPKGVRVTRHEINPLEINIVEDTAYDYGYYEGTTLNADGSEVSWKGKYVIVWKKTDEGWKIYLDIWNRIAD
ncbi:MAG: DUF4440 domain-containing protein [Bacteroidetes bacterium]|nr:DUF4440 domain-containing protein [Bacteroidota bacterium]